MFRLHFAWLSESQCLRNLGDVFAPNGSNYDWVGLIDEPGIPVSNRARIGGRRKAALEYGDVD